MDGLSLQILRQVCILQSHSLVFIEFRPAKHDFLMSHFLKSSNYVMHISFSALFEAVVTQRRHSQASDVMPFPYSRSCFESLL